MLASQYSHRLPADYDMAAVRRRAASLAPLWEDTEGLAFKVFLARERGRLGAAGNLYASFYLWLDTSAAAQFVMGERFRNVIAGFGRPRIETWLPLDARAGRTRQALALYRDELPLAEDADLAAVLTAESERNRAMAQEEDTCAVLTAVDVAAWRLLRISLSSAPPDAARPGIAYEVLHLARPGLDRLAPAAWPTPGRPKAAAAPGAARTRSAERGGRD